MTSSSHQRTSATCCATSTAIRPRSSGDSPSRLRRPDSASSCPALCSLGNDSSGISRTAPDHPGKPGGRDLAGVALAELPMTRPETVRPHPGFYGLFYFFSNLFCELGAPLRNRTVDLLLTITMASCTTSASCTDDTGYRTDSTG